MSHNPPLRLAWLDATRGLAVLLVLLDHGIRGTQPELDQIITQYFNLGNFGVMLFFFCSGFIIPISLESGGLRQFWIRRFFRLYPLFWFSIIVAVITGSTETNNTSHILANFTMVHGFFNIESVNNVFWSLAIEILFYLFLSLLFPLNLTNQNTQIAVGFITISIIVEGILGIPPWLSSYLATMFIGTAFYRYSVGKTSKKTVISLVIAGICMSIITRLGIRLDRAEYSHWAASCVVAYITFSLIFLFRSKNWPQIMAQIGTISYSLYLMHISVFYVFNITIDPWTKLSIWITAAIVVSIITYYCIEKPSIKLGRYLTPPNKGKHNI